MRRSVCFLSCLCGSEQGHQIGLQRLYFLSCLCGSELIHTMDGEYREFLSCLCGSELRMATIFRF